MLNCTFRSAKITSCWTGPLHAIGQSNERIDDEPLEAAVGYADSNLNRVRGADVVAAANQRAVMRSDAEVTAVPPEIPADGGEGVALPDVSVGRGLGLVAHLGSKTRREDAEYDVMSAASLSARMTTCSSVALSQVPPCHLRPAARPRANPGRSAPRRAASRRPGARQHRCPPQPAEPDWWYAPCEPLRWRGRSSSRSCRDRL